MTGHNEEGPGHNGETKPRGPAVPGAVAVAEVAAAAAASSPPPEKPPTPGRARSSSRWETVVGEPTSGTPRPGGLASQFRGFLGMKASCFVTRAEAVPEDGLTVGSLSETLKTELGKRLRVWKPGPPRPSMTLPPAPKRWRGPALHHGLQRGPA